MICISCGMCGMLRHRLTVKQLTDFKCPGEQHSRRGINSVTRRAKQSGRQVTGRSGCGFRVYGADEVFRWASLG